MTWNPKGSFLAYTLERFELEIPLPLSTDAKGYHFHVRSQLAETTLLVGSGKENHFDHAKERILNAIRQAIRLIPSGETNRIHRFMMKIKDCKRVT